MQKIIDKLKELQIPEREISWLLSELNYQSQRWNKDTTSTEGVHDLYEFATFIQDYNNEMIHILSRKGEPIASEEAMNSIRKMAALCVSALYQNGFIDSLNDNTIGDQYCLKNPTHAANFINNFLKKIYKGQYLDLNFLKNQQVKEQHLDIQNECTVFWLNSIFSTCLFVAKKTKNLPLRVSNHTNGIIEFI